MGNNNDSAVFAIAWPHHYHSLVVHYTIAENLTHIIHFKFAMNNLIRYIAKEGIKCCCPQGPQKSHLTWLISSGFRHDVYIAALVYIYVKPKKGTPSLDFLQLRLTIFNKIYNYQVIYLLILLRIM